MTARPQDVALLPVHIQLEVAVLGYRTAEAEGVSEAETKHRWDHVMECVRDYARANVTSALASAQAREEELRADRDSWAQQASDRAADWHAEHQRAERLAEALREARDYVASELSDERAKFAGYEHCSSIASIEADLARIDAALSTNAATQTGERNG